MPYGPWIPCRPRQVCNVAPIPGETKVWQYITLMKRIFLIDCPGVVYNKTDDSETDIVLKGVVRVENLVRSGGAGAAACCSLLAGCGRGVTRAGSLGQGPWPPPILSRCAVGLQRRARLPGASVRPTPPTPPARPTCPPAGGRHRACGACA